jgi:DeoR/GlpR family transcriptional regulator of sugar metabolism
LLSNPRFTEIMKILYKLKNVTVQTLTERLNVSEVTIRKDLSTLEAHGKIIRTHGGAFLAEDMQKYNPVNMRYNDQILEKAAIAKKARELIREDDTIYLDSGSTCFFLAREIKDMNLRVVTDSLDVINELSKSQNISLFVLGGGFRPDAGSFIGPIAEKTVRNFQIKTCFIGTSGISVDGNFSSQNTIEAQLKQSVIQSSQRKVVLADSSKFGITAFSIFAKPGEIDILVVDDKIKDSEKLRSLDMEIIIASADR